MVVLEEYMSWFSAPQTNRKIGELVGGADTVWYYGAERRRDYRCCSMLMDEISCSNTKSEQVISWTWRKKRSLLLLLGSTLVLIVNGSNHIYK